MTSQPQLTDDLIREMLERRARASATDGLLQAIVEQAATTPQAARHALALPVAPWLTQIARGAAVLAILVAGLVIVGPTLFEPAAPTLPPSPSPAATTDASAAPSAAIGKVVASGVDGAPLPGGRWETSGFDPTLRFTVPDQLWTAGVDLPRQFWLRGHLPGAPPAEFDAVTLVTIQNVYVDPCTSGAASTELWGVGRPPEDLLDWLETNMDADLGERRPVTVLGYEGLEVEFTMPDLSHCEMGFMPITDNGRLSPFGTGPAGQPTRYAVIDLEGATVLVLTFTDDPARRDAVWAAADAVLESMEIVP